MYKSSKITPGGTIRARALSVFGVLLGVTFLMATSATAAEVPFAIYDHDCYDWTNNSNSACANVANYFNAQSQRGWETNLWRYANGWTAQWHVPEPTKLTYNYSVTYYVYRNNKWVPVADVGNKITYGEKIKTELTKNAEWRGSSGWFWDTPAAHFKDTFDWTGLQGCFAEDYFGETDVTNSENARWNRWGLIDDQGHLGYQGSRLTGPVIFKNPSITLAAPGFTCNGAECTAPSTDGSYTIQTKVGATEARQEFFGLIQSPDFGVTNECSYPGSGFPDPTKMCHEQCGSGGCSPYAKQAGETYEQCYARVKAGPASKYWNCQSQGKLLGCMPITFANLPIAESQRLANEGTYPSSYMKSMPIVEASAFIPNWPAEGSTDTTIKIIVGPPSGNVPQVTVTPDQENLLENQETQVTCSAINPTIGNITAKITKIEWSCLNNTSNTTVNCPIFNGQNWISSGSYSFDIPSSSQSSSYTSTVKVKALVKGDYTVKCSATNSSSLTGSGFAGIKIGDCSEDGVCNKACPYDPDCCKDPYCEPYCPGYGNPHCVVAAGICTVLRTSPSLETNDVKLNEPVKYRATVFGGVNPIAYLWSCDTNKPDEVTRQASTAKTDERTCEYSDEGPYEPKVEYEHKDEKGVTQTGTCVNSNGIGINVTGVRPVSTCNVLVKNSNDSTFSNNITVDDGDTVNVKVDTGTGTRQNPISWKFNGSQFIADYNNLSRIFEANTKIEATVDGKNCNSAFVNVKEKVRFNQ